ncbi:MAG: VCBS repeat-containing protein [Acidobacteriota bacterium]
MSQSSVRERSHSVVERRLSATAIVLLMVATIGLAPTAPAREAAAEAATETPMHRLHPLDGEGVRGLLVALPEAVVDLELWPGAETPRLAVLTAPDEPDDAPRTLWRVDASGAHRLLDLPNDAEALAVVGDDLWLGREGAIERLRQGSSGEAAVDRQPLFEQPGLRLALLESGGLLPMANRPTQLLIPKVGALQAFRLDDGMLRASGRSTLPTTARRTRQGVVLESPAITRLADGALIAGPRESGRSRVLSHLIPPPTAETDAPADDLFVRQPAETWSRLPGPEEIVWSRYASFDGRPALIAATVEADRFSIFADLRLRVLPLRADRTRAGAPPALAADTDAGRFFSPEAVVADFDADGDDDLVFLYSEGLRGGDLVLELYPARGDGWAFERPRRSDVDAPRAAWSFGEDLDGDGAPDLVTVADGHLKIWRGLANDRRRVVAKRPWRDLELGDLVNDPPVGEDAVEDAGGGRIRFRGAPRVLRTLKSGVPLLAGSARRDNGAWLYYLEIL